VPRQTHLLIRPHKKAVNDFSNSSMNKQVPVKLVSLENRLRSYSEAFFQLNFMNWEFVVTNYYTAQTSSSKTLPLFGNLLTAFYKSAEAYGVTDGGRKAISGLYVIFNKNNHTTYIGESRHVYRRFDQHLTDLLLGIHSNTNLQSDMNSYANKLDSFILLVYDFGYSLNNRDTRLLEERRLIQNWPGKLYNVVHNNQ
jgi:hypothetical protein